VRQHWFGSQRLLPQEGYGILRATLASLTSHEWTSPKRLRPGQHPVGVGGVIATELPLTFSLRLLPDRIRRNWPQKTTACDGCVFMSADRSACDPGGVLQHLGSWRLACRSVVNWLSTKPCSEADIKLKVRSSSAGVVSRKTALPQILVARVWAPALLPNPGGTGPDEF
jgi:hypothetical protein